MKKLSLLRKDVKKNLLFMLLFFCLLVTGCSKQLYQYSAPTEAQHYPILKYKLIELIDALPKPMPTTVEKLQSLFNNQLHIESENEYFIFYIGGPFITRDGVIILDVDARIRKKDHPGVKQISFSIDQRQCVSTELLKKKYNFHIISLNSPEPVEHPKISYDADLAWGTFAVGTTLDNQNCATGIIVSVL